MGKSYDENSRKRSSPSSRRDEDEAKRSRRRDKEDDKKHKSKKSHESRKHCSNEDEKLHRKTKDSRRMHDDVPKSKIQELSNDDYFSKNNEFATWLKKERKLYFSDLSSDSARALFSEFVAMWNKQELDREYYDGITSGPRSSHKWNIKK